MAVSRILILLGALVVSLASTPADALVRDFEPLRHIKPGRARCLLARHPQFVSAWLRSLGGSAEETALIKKNSANIIACFGTNSDGSAWETYYDYTRIRAGLVRTLLQSRRDSIPKTYPMETKSGGANSSALDKRTAATTAAAFTEQAGNCLARRNWNGVRNIILAVDPRMERNYDMTKSAIEREVRLVDLEMETMIALLPDCIPPGSRITIERAKLRDVIEEAALHALGAYPETRAGLALGEHHA